MGPISRLFRQKGGDSATMSVENPMGVPKGPTEGGSGGKRGHSAMEHWGFHDKVKEAARRRRRINDRSEVVAQSKDLDPPPEMEDAE
jgi:hypothetical protein